MKYINIVVEGSSEESFVNDVMVKHFVPLDKYISVRKILTGWDKVNNKPAKGGLLKYDKLKNDINRWIKSDNGKKDTFYTCFVDLYAFPKEAESPYTNEIQKIKDPYKKIKVLENAIKSDIGTPLFIPYVQLHEFEAFLMVCPDRMSVLYPDKQSKIEILKKDISNISPEEVNESPLTVPSKRIIKLIPEYEGQKAQAGPLVAEDIGMTELRAKCPHFNEWITKLENL